MNPEASIASYDLMRRVDGIPEFELLANVSADAAGRQTYHDGTVSPGIVYTYRIDAIAMNGERYTLGSWTVEVNGPAVPSILGTIPNPTRDAVTVQFAIPSTQDVRLSILDAGGRVVRSYEASDLSAGAHELRWDLKDANGRRMGPGVYPYRLETGGSHLTGKITVVK